MSNSKKSGKIGKPGITRDFFYLWFYSLGKILGINSGFGCYHKKKETLRKKGGKNLLSSRIATNPDP